MPIAIGVGLRRHVRRLRHQDLILVRGIVHPVGRVITIIVPLVIVPKYPSMNEANAWLLLS